MTTITTRRAPRRSLTDEPAAAEVQAAFEDRRVRRAVLLVVRDQRMRRRFTALRDEGRSVAEAVEVLLGPYADADGRPYFLSEERVRAVVYRKGR